MDDLKAKIHSAVAKQPFDALMVAGVDNFTYFTQAVLPFAHNYPDKLAALVMSRDGEGCVVCPFEWVEAIVDQGWKGDIECYREDADAPLKSAITSLAGVVSERELENSKLGLDRSNVSKLLMDGLRRCLPAVDWSSCDGLLRSLRIIKTPEEVGLLEKASWHSERGIIFALNHLEGTVGGPGYSVAEFSERVRVHVCESGGSGIAHLSTVQGADAQAIYAPQQGRFHLGSLVRVDVANHLMGYWSNAGRMFVVGRPSTQQVRLYGENLRLKAEAVKMLSPGVSCSEVFDEVKAAARRIGVRFWEEVGVGHGVGVSPVEPPYLNSQDATRLEPGMTLALDVYTRGPDGELIHSKDTYEIVDGGSRLLSWYRTWDKLYEAGGFRATH